MLFIDMGEVDYEPSQFLSSIDGERLHLIKNGSGQADSIYLPKQITFFGMKSDALAEDLKTQLLRKGYVHVYNVGSGPLTFVRFLCPKPPSVLNQLQISSGFPI